MEKEEQKAVKAGHALIFPYPSQGHINPLLEFSKRLVYKGVKATLVTTKHIKISMFADPNSPIPLETISDGFDDGGSSQAESTAAYLSSLELVGSRTLSTLIKKLNQSDPVDVIIYDGFLPWVLDVAKQFGIKKVAFFTQACAVNTIYYHVYKSLLPLPLSPEQGTVSFPGLPVLEVADTPSFVSNFGSHPAWYDTVVNQFRNIHEADWLLYNSFYKLEKEVVDWMAKQWPLSTVGPTVPSMYLDKRIEDDKDYGINLFKPKSSICMDWLNGKPKGSVVYVSFGSAAVLGDEQMAELAWGLKGSNCYFLWVVRALEEAKLPANFKDDDDDDKGLVVTWCPQVEVLAHEAIGCFVTHCGFNSVIEALSLGVPLVAMPRWTDQPTNAKLVEHVWKIGIRVRADDDGVVRREAMEKCIREVMERVEIKENAEKWRSLAKEAVDAGGSSDQNINQFVANFLCSVN